MSVGDHAAMASAIERAMSASRPVMTPDLRDWLEVFTPRVAVSSYLDLMERVYARVGQ